MGRIALPVLVSLLLVAGCAPWRSALPTPPEVTQNGVAARLLIPPDLNVDPAETVVKPGRGALRTNRQVLTSNSSRRSSLRCRRPSPSQCKTARGCGVSGVPPMDWTLRPRASGLRRSFLPQIDLVGQYGDVSATFAPGIPGNEGFLLPSSFGTRSYAQTEVGLEWTLYDFGRTGGRYRQAAAREHITELQLVRANQTVEFDVANAYLDVLLARASRRVQEDAVRRAQAILDDTAARREGGVALKEDVLRADVQLSESREALVVARQERAFNAAWPA